jgi:hypothetical protein
MGIFVGERAPFDASRASRDPADRRRKLACGVRPRGRP